MSAWPSVASDERAAQSFDPEGLSYLITRILEPWTCAACRLDWVECRLPRFAGLFMGNRQEAHTWDSGCALRNYHDHTHLSRSRGGR